MATLSSTSPLLLCSSDSHHALHFLVSHSNFNASRLFSRTCVATGIQMSRNLRFRVCSQSKTEEMQIRRCPPLLERTSLSSNGALASDEWKAVPDIWRSSAEKYGDRVALVDPYHDPPSNMTYKQLEQEILDFAEGLRIIGVKPEEKLSLFADNSCRWIVADQGIMATGAVNVVRGSRSSVEELLQIYSHSESVALAVDNPEFFNRIAETFCSKSAMRFVILLWGKKSCLATDRMDGIPVFNYDEVIDLGRESRRVLSASHDASQQYIYETINSDDIATLVYTSGTSGNPKGVMLTHKNLLHQHVDVDAFDNDVFVDPKDEATHKKIIKKRRTFKFLLGLNRNLDDVSSERLFQRLCMKKVGGRSCSVLTVAVLNLMRVLWQLVEAKTSRSTINLGKAAHGVIIANGLIILKIAAGKPAEWKPKVEREGHESMTVYGDSPTTSARLVSKEQMNLLQNLINQQPQSIIASRSLAHSGNHLTALNAKQVPNESWIVYSGASDHMTGDVKVFATYSPYHNNLNIRIADESLSNVARIGSVAIISTIILDSVLFVPKLDCNILSVRKLTHDKNCVVKFFYKLYLFQDLGSGGRLTILKSVLDSTISKHNLLWEHHLFQ